MIEYFTYKFSRKNNNYSLSLFTFFLFIFLILNENIYSQTLSAEKIYEKVKDAVVVIYAYNYSDELAAQGSGVVLNDKGYVVTNYHVLSGNERLEIMHGEEIVPYVDIIGIDVEKDILILKIEDKKFPPLKIGNVKKLRVGQKVYAIGSPMGFENTISEGIISGLRSYDELSKNYIQITASISHGSRGGAVVNDKGELIGISTLTVSDGQSLNFAIPIDEVLNVEIGSYNNYKRFKDYELFRKGLVAHQKGKYRDAINYYSRFIEIFPSSEEAYHNRAIAKFELKDYRGAIQDYSRSIELNPFNYDAYNSRDRIRTELGDYESALRDFNYSIWINQSYGIAYYNRGILKHILGDEDGACWDWSKAGELGYYEVYDFIRDYCK